MPGRDNEQDQDNVERRRFLMGTGAGALAVGLAGCSSSGGSPTQGSSPTETSSPTVQTASPTPTGGVNKGGTMTMGLPEPPKGVNILATSSAYSGAIYDHLHAFGVSVEPVNFEVNPWVYTDWTVENVDSGEPDVYFNVVEGHTFNDGEELTVEDVRWTYNFLLDVVPGKYSGVISTIDSVEEASNDWDLHMKMNTVDALYETRALGGLPILPKHIWSNIDNPLQYAPGEKDGRPVGAGWASLTKYDPDTAAEVNFRDDFMLTEHDWVDEHPALLTGGPHLDKLRFKIYSSTSKLEQALLNGKLDTIYGSITGKNKSSVQDNDRLSLITGQDSGFGYVGYNLRRTPMDDTTFRQAMSFLWDDIYWTRRLNQNQSIEGDFVISPGYKAVRPETGNDDVELLTDPATQAFHFRQSTAGVPDYSGIRKFLTEGKVIDGEGGTYVGQDYPGSITGVKAKQSESLHNYSFGPVKSQVLKDAGADKEIRVNGKTIPEMKGSPLTYLMYPPSTVPELTKMDEQFTKNMKNLGIPVKRKVQTFNSLLARIYKQENFDMYHMGWGTGPFGASTLKALFHSDAADDHSVRETVGGEKADKKNMSLSKNNSYGYGLFDNGGADDLIDEALKTMDAQKRNETTRKAVERIYLDHPIDVYQFSKINWPADTKKFTGYLTGIVAPGGTYYTNHFYNVHLKE